MRLRPLPLLLAPLWLLAVLCILGACTPIAHSSASGAEGGGAATSSGITILPASTTIIGLTADTAQPLPTPQAPTPIPALPSGLSPTELKYRLLAQYPDFFFCDTDLYPVARNDEGSLALQRFPAIQANQEEFQAILAHNGMSGQTTFTDEQKLHIYQEYKKLAAIHFELVGDQYQFQVTTGGPGKSSFNIKGLIDGTGNITVQQRTAGIATCPICLAAHTLIDTPHGAVFVEDIKPGDLVWTVNRSGERLSAPVLRVVRVPVSAGHEMVHLRLDDGRELWASPGHPTADGRVLGELLPGDKIDGTRVTLAERVAYDGPATYDLLPADGTGFYWADGILIGSTLSQP